MRDKGEGKKTLTRDQERDGFELSLRVLRNEGLCILVDDVDIFPFAEYAEVVQGRVDKVLDSAGLRIDRARSIGRTNEENTSQFFPLLVSRTESLQHEQETREQMRRKNEGRGYSP